MTIIAVVGSQWGDEGEGKITDYLGQEAELIVRSDGGNNAGHIIVFSSHTFKMRLIPSGIFTVRKGAIIGNGVVINLEVLFGEIKYLQEHGVGTGSSKISNRAHIIMPYNILQDVCQEEAKGANKVGTTENGIGPIYMDKALGIGIRMCDLLEKDTFEEKLRSNLTEKSALFEKVHGKEGLKFEETFDKYYQYRQELRKHVTDTSVYVNEAVETGDKVLFEGA